MRLVPFSPKKKSKKTDFFLKNGFTNRSYLFSLGVISRYHNYRFPPNLSQKVSKGNCVHIQQLKTASADESLLGKIQEYFCRGWVNTADGAIAKKKVTSCVHFDTPSVTSNLM